MFAASTFKNKRVAMFGLARSGISCALALQEGGAIVFAWDDSEPAQEKALADGVNVTNLHTIDFKTLHALVLSPGVPLTHPDPHWTVIKAKAAGLEVIGDTEVFAREVQDTGSKIIAITGTNGKSTTTALIGHVLKHAGLDVDVGGNIGNAVFNLRVPTRGRIYVLELSSFQIDLMPGLAPDIGILTNLTPDHLDRHGTMQHYAEVKARMFAKQHDGQTALIGVDDSWGKSIAETVRSGANVLPVTVTASLHNGLSAEGGVLRHLKDGVLVATLDLRGLPALRGQHNWQNACMAYGAANALGIEASVILDAMKSFPGLAHRMQQVATLKKVAFVNDSKATNADAAEKALASYDNVFWIAGGLAKTGGIAALAPHFGRIRKAYLIGVSAKDIAEELNGRVPYVVAETMVRAVQLAAQDAAECEIPNAVVLLSPACASFDQYKNFEVRGDDFVGAVSRLQGIAMMNGSTL
jgi:UDP-N-acetylmuramoylalanine--D-glutamate ligase